MPTPANVSPQFVLVKSTNPNREGQYGRAGLRFSRNWRALQVDDIDDRDLAPIPPVVTIATPTVPAVVVTPGDPGTNNMPLRAKRGEDNLISVWTLKILDADTFLAVKPATASDIAKLEAELAETGGDKDATIDALRSQNADYEARLMRIEARMSSAGDANDAIARLKAQLADAQAKADTEAKARTKAESDLKAQLDAQAKADAKAAKAAGSEKPADK